MEIGRVMIPVTDAHVHVATTFVKETVTNIFSQEARRVSCHQKVISLKVVFQFLTVWAETLHDNRTLYSQQSYVYGFLKLTVFGAKMTS